MPKAEPLPLSHLYTMATAKITPIKAAPTPTPIPTTVPLARPVGGDGGVLDVPELVGVETADTVLLVGTFVANSGRVMLFGSKLLCKPD